jgi:hypothetical protein
MVNLMASEHEATGAVKRTTELSEDVVQALEDNGRAVVAALGRFLVGVEEVWPQAERARTAEKKLTESAVELLQQLVTRNPSSCTRC